MAHAVTTTRKEEEERRPAGSLRLRRWRAALLTIINMIAIIRTRAGVRPNGQPTTTVARPRRQKRLADASTMTPGNRIGMKLLGTGLFLGGYPRF